MGGLRGFLRGVGECLDDASRVLFPLQCHICGERVAPGERWLCSGCLQSLPWTRFEAWENNPMAMRLAGKVPFKRASAFLIYHPDGRLAPLFHDFKYNGCNDLARYMGKLAGFHIGGMILKDVDALLPIPMFWFKKLRRGYNQAEEIAAGISAETGIPIAKGLRAIHPHKTQTHLNALQRSLNTQDVFQYNPEPALRGKHVAVIDDICTTGSTLVSAGRAVLAGDPCATLSFLTLGVVL